MDKVLVNRTYSTLNVVCLALLLSSVFEVLLTGLRNYVFSHTTNRIDVELGARLFRHLVALPLGYFGARSRAREHPQFPDGPGPTAFVDLVFSVVFLGVMCIYSVWLTLMVAAARRHIRAARSLVSGEARRKVRARRR